MTSLTDSESALIDGVFELAHAGPDADSPERKEALWCIGVTMLADVLLSKPEIEREMLLRGLWRELRAAVVVNPMPLDAAARLRFEVVDASRPGVLQMLTDLGFNPIFVGMTFRICLDGTMRPASKFEIDLPRDRMPVPDAPATIQGEIAKPKKTKDEVEKVLRYLGKA